MFLILLLLLTLPAHAASWTPRNIVAAIDAHCPGAEFVYHSKGSRLVWIDGKGCAAPTMTTVAQWVADLPEPKPVGDTITSETTLDELKAILRRVLR
jgi:hypothetical protein